MAALRRNWVTILIGALAVFVVCGRALLPHATLLPLDFLHQALLPWANDVTRPAFHDQYEIDAVQEYLPLYQLHADALRAGSVPTWNPFNRGGTAYLDNPVPLPFHPLKLLLAVLTPEQFFDLLATFHFVLAFVSMVLYLRRCGLAEPAVMFGALSWSFCAYFVTNFVHERSMGPVAALPLGLLMAERLYEVPGAARAAWFGLVFGSILLICDPTGILIYLFAFGARLVGYWLFESRPLTSSRAIWLSVAALIAGMFAAPNLLSALEGIAANVRVFDYEGAYSVPGGVLRAVGGYLALLLSAVHPYALGSRDSLDLLKVTGQTITLIPFAGSFALLFAALAVGHLRAQRAWRWLVLMLALGLILLSPPAVKALATRNVILLTFVLTVAAAAGMHVFWTAPARLQHRAGRVVLWLALAAWMLFLAREFVLVRHGEQIAAAIRRGIEMRMPGYLLERYAQWKLEAGDRFLALQRLSSPPNLLFLAGLGVLALAWWRWASSGDRRARTMVLCLACAAPVLYALDNVHVLDLRRYPIPQTPDGLVLHGVDPGPPRIVIPRDTPDDRLLLPGLLPQLFGLGQVQGYGSVVALGPFMLTDRLPLHHPLYEVLGVNYMVAARDSPARSEAFPRTVHRGAINVYAREPLASRFHLTGRIASAADRQSALEQARADLRPVSRRVFHVTDLPAGLLPGVEEVSGDIHVLRDEPAGILLDVRADATALLVVGTSYYPGWHADVDGAEAKILCVDGTMQGVVVPRGRSRVALRFSHWPSRIGFVLQAIALVLIVVHARARHDKNS